MEARESTIGSIGPSQSGPDRPNKVCCFHRRHPSVPVLFDGADFATTGSDASSCILDSWFVGDSLSPHPSPRPPEGCDGNRTSIGVRSDKLYSGSNVMLFAGDFNLAGVTSLVDPCPLPSAAKKKGLRDKEKLFYAPMSGLGDLLYDKDAVYININDHLVQFSNTDETGSATGKDRDVGDCMENFFYLSGQRQCRGYFGDM